MLAGKLTKAEMEAVLRLISNRTDAIASRNSTKAEDEEYHLLRDASEILRQQGVA